MSDPFLIPTDDRICGLNGVSVRVMLIRSGLRNESVSITGKLIVKPEVSGFMRVWVQFATAGDSECREISATDLATLSPDGDGWVLSRG